MVLLWVIIIDLDLSSTTGDINFQDGGVDQISFEMDATATEVAIQQKVDGDDLVFKQYDGNECARVHDSGVGGSPIFLNNAGGYGLGYKRAVYKLTGTSGAVAAAVAVQDSGCIFTCDASSNNIVFTLPVAVVGLTYTFVLTRANTGGTIISILTNGATTDNNDNFDLIGINDSTAYSDGDGDTITFPNSCIAYTRCIITCIKSGASEIWMAEAHSTGHTLTVTDS